MRTKIFSVLAIMILTLAACKENIIVEENSYCVNIVKKTPESTTLSESELNEIKNLFSRNNIDYTKYLFTRLQKDEAGNRHVRCYQFVNNMIVFTGEVIFHFDKYDSSLPFISGDLISAINLNTKPSMKQNTVVDIFINTVGQDGQMSENIINDCFDMEFGYYDLNASIGFADEKYVKAWRINLKNYEHVLAYINDETSELIYYDNGIRTVSAISTFSRLSLRYCLLPTDKRLLHNASYLL